jgi:hypothetical protein
MPHWFGSGIRTIISFFHALEGPMTATLRYMHPTIRTRRPGPASGGIKDLGAAN